jgi:hypothetical protein
MAGRSGTDRRQPLSGGLMVCRDNRMFTPLYPLPPMLQGTVTQADYNTWVLRKARELFSKDLKRNRAYALAGSRKKYRDEIHGAVMENGITDPFSGDKLKWDLILKWDDSKDKGHQNFVKKFYLLPTADHKDPYGKDLDFEICSWLINSCKNDQTPEEFIKMCADIVKHRRSKSAANSTGHHLSDGPLSVPQVFFLPPFLNGICTEAVYRKWLDRHAGTIYLRDRKQRRPYALSGSKGLYKKAIHAAVNASGLCDPFTGETMKWEIIGTWDPAKIKDQPDGFKKFYLLPTVDHVNPYADILEFEICSWRINCCKSGLTPNEFVEVCRKVVEHTK